MSRYLPAHRVHQEHRGQGAQQRADAQQAGHPGGLVRGDGEGGVGGGEGGGGAGGEAHAHPVTQAARADR